VERMNASSFPSLIQAGERPMKRGSSNVASDAKVAKCILLETLSIPSGCGTERYHCVERLKLLAPVTRVSHLE